MTTSTPVELWKVKDDYAEKKGTDVLLRRYNFYGNILFCCTGGVSYLMKTGRGRGTIHRVLGMRSGAGIA